MRQSIDEARLAAWMEHNIANGASWAKTPSIKFQTRHPGVTIAVDCLLMGKFAIAIAIAAAAEQPALAWGYKEHEIFASIARDRLTPATKARVYAKLAKDADTLTAPDIISRATWAAKWRDSGHRETASWHFVDQELVGPDLKTACFDYPKASAPPSDGPTQDCVVNKIGEFAKELSDPSTPDSERILALKYILHFVGDVHQPLHASDNHDRGGNCVHISLGGQRTTNLRSFWDMGVLASLGDDPSAIAKTLNAEITPDEAKAWSATPPEAWAGESFAAAKASAYTINSPSGCASDGTPIPLCEAYQAQALQVDRQQIEKAGIRLAAMLNTAAAKADRSGS